MLNVKIEIFLVKIYIRYRYILKLNVKGIYKNNEHTFPVNFK